MLSFTGQGLMPERGKYLGNASGIRWVTGFVPSVRRCSAPTKLSAAPNPCPAARFLWFNKLA
jgi:hypothetical protein